MPGDRSLPPISPLAVALVLTSALAWLGACDDVHSPNPSMEFRLEKTASNHGDGQLDTVLTTLGMPLRVRVTSAADPAAGVAVTWTTSDGAGANGSRLTTSDSLGIASLAWTLGPVPGTQIMEASVTGATGSPVTFVAIAKARVLGEASVSDPVAAETSESMTAAAESVSMTAVAESVPAPVYVSLPPGTFVGAVRAKVQHPISKAFVLRNMVDGGFDPVPLTANEGDELDVEIEMADGGRRYYSVRVPAKSRPRVVRVAPPPRKRDVPLNSVIAVVFTEPMASGSVNAHTVRLLRGSAAVGGRVVVSGGGVRADIVPDQVLTANTEYTLVVTAEVRDLDGEQLGEEITSDFTTGNAASAPASVTITPAGAAVLADTERVESRAKLTATVLDANGNQLDGADVVWATGNSSVATIDSSGTVVGWRPGTAVITARAGNVSESTTISVLPRIADIVITPWQTTLRLGDTLRVSAAIIDSLGRPITAYRLSWSTSANSELVITSASDNAATVRAVRSGNARLHVAFQPATGSGWVAGAWNSQIAVTSPHPAAFLKVLPETIRTMPHRYSHSIETRAILTDASGNEVLVFSPSTVLWRSSNLSAVGISSGGAEDGHAYNHVWGRANGTADVTASAGSLTARQTVIVEALTLSAMSLSLNSYQCLLTTAGAAYCKGTNQSGEVGHGLAGVSASAFVGVAGTHRFKAISSGWSFSCALTDTGEAYCWGSNSLGPSAIGLLGTGKSEGVCNPDDGNHPGIDCSAVPVRVASSVVFRELDAGAVHMCALSSEGSAYCWGQLGDGTTTNRPTAVSTALRFQRITAGVTHNCALTEDGTAYCWGANGQGQLGDGTLNDASTPVRVAGGQTFVDISAGVAQTCAVSANGALYCWGLKDFAEVSTGTSNSTPVAIALPTGVSIKAIDVGEGSACALDASGTPYCWGYEYGGPADGPFVIPLTKVPGGLRFESVRAGGHFYACGVTLEPAVYCWDHPIETPQRLEGQKP